MTWGEAVDEVKRRAEQGKEAHVVALHRIDGWEYAVENGPDPRQHGGELIRGWESIV